MITKEQASVIKDMAVVFACEKAIYSLMRDAQGQAQEEAFQKMTLAQNTLNKFVESLIE